MAEKTFEDALARLEEIVRTMEEGNLTLDESLKSFEEGIGLARWCAKKLDDAERRVELLLKEGDETVTKPFEKDEDDGAE